MRTGARGWEGNLLFWFFSVHHLSWSENSKFVDDFLYNGRSMVLLEDQLYWRQSTGLDGNYRSRKITARRWLHKYVGAECGASSFTRYLYQICNTDVRLSVWGQNCVCSVSSTILIRSISYFHILSSNFRRGVACNACFKIQKFWKNF